MSGLKKDELLPKGLISPAQKRKTSLIFIIVLGIYFYSTYATQFDLEKLARGSSNMANILGDLFPPNLNYAKKVLPVLLETFYMAVIASTIGTLIAIPFCLLAAKNINPNRFSYNIFRVFLNLVRTIPDIILAVIFVGIFGSNAFSGILALAIFSIGILAKLLADSLETIDKRPLEAMRASGANTLQMIWYAVVPQILPQFTSYALYVFELNIRGSVVLGFVGAGGIGVLLQQSMNLFRYDNAMMVILITFIAVVVIDFISTKIREAIV